MFDGATSFNNAGSNNIGSWVVSNVTNMHDMFAKASSFNQDISKWNLSKVTNMYGMFREASSFNQDIGSWNVSNVTHMDMMFRKTDSFNQDISKWDVSSVKGMESMFENAVSFNQNIESWDVSSVINMRSMFDYSSLFSQDIGKWPIKKDCDTLYMFYYCPIKKETFEGKLYGNKIAEYFDLDNPNEFMVWEPYTRWERRKNAVMFFSSISKLNIKDKIDKDSEETQSDIILNYLHSIDNDIYKEIVYFI